MSVGFRIKHIVEAQPEAPRISKEENWDKGAQYAEKDKQHSGRNLREEVKDKIAAERNENSHAVVK